ncbi:MAG: hypothetical protein ABJC19_12330, partial [Gemmatimonadota bacterium]
MPRFIYAVAAAALLGACHGDTALPDPDLPVPTLDPVLVAQGQDIFRYDTFGDDNFWTDTLRIHEVIQSALTPRLALQLGLQVDVDALPPAVQQALAAGQVNLDDPATTVTLLKLRSVVGVMGQVETINGRDTLTRVGVTCALCHSMVDNSFAPGIGHRRDGFANVALNPGAIIATSPALSAAQKAVYNSWGAGHYDPRYNIDGKNTPIVLPPIYGLARVSHETFTGDGVMSYWNAYVGVTQMHGKGNFSDPRLGISRTAAVDMVTPKLPALREYQMSLQTPAPPAGFADANAAIRGRAVFEVKGRCATCHLGLTLTDINLGRRHAAADVGQDGSYAARTATRLYRTTPLRGLWQHAPYFHDGSAASLEAVVEHYQQQFKLGLSSTEKADLVQYLRT